MIGKIHQRQNQSILAVCDKEHVGKVFEDGKIYFNASKHFYGNEEITEEQFLELIKEANSINLFGNKCIEILEREGLINKTSVILINGIKHAQIYQL
ncbi:MAG: DUF424 family protein [archaeon]|jgi:hypothetical protein